MDCTDVIAIIVNEIYLVIQVICVVIVKLVGTTVMDLQAVVVCTSFLWWVVQVWAEPRVVVVPSKFSPVCGDGDMGLIVESFDLGVIDVDEVQEGLDHVEALSFLLDECKDHAVFIAVCWKCTQQEVWGSGKVLQLWYRLLLYAYLIRQTGMFIFSLQ